MSAQPECVVRCTANQYGIEVLTSEKAEGLVVTRVLLVFTQYILTRRKQ